MGQDPSSGDSIGCICLHGDRCTSGLGWFDRKGGKGTHSGLFAWRVRTDQDPAYERSISRKLTLLFMVLSKPKQTWKTCILSIFKNLHIRVEINPTEIKAAACRAICIRVLLFSGTCPSIGKRLCKSGEFIPLKIMHLLKSELQLYILTCRAFHDICMSTKRKLCIYISITTCYDSIFVWNRKNRSTCL